MNIRRIFQGAIGSVVLFSATAIYSQDSTPGDPKPAASAAVTKTPDARPGILAQLGLTSEQVQQIRRLNLDRKPLMVAAQIRLRAANRALDAAIYADQVSDSDVEARIAEAQAAQAEVAKLRSMNEYAVRKVLTPEQLVHFRELRRKFEEMRKEMQPQRPNRRRSLDIKQPGPNGTPPMRRLIKQGQQRPPLH